MSQIMQALQVPTILVVGDGRLTGWTPAPLHAGIWHVTKRVEDDASLVRIGANRTIHESEQMYLKTSLEPP